MAYATGSTGLAITVRGSSRRIMIMRFRPANIRLINRRSNLPRLLLALSSGKSKNNDNDKNNPIDSAGLTGSLHIRPTRSLTVLRWLISPETDRSISHCQQTSAYRGAVRLSMKMTLDPDLAEEAKALVALAFRNGPIEDLHAGRPCKVCSGNQEISHISDEEMKAIMKVGGQ